MVASSYLIGYWFLCYGESMDFPPSWETIETNKIAQGTLIHGSLELDLLKAGDIL